MKLKEWNYKTIYESDIANKNYEKIDKLFKPLYNKYLEKLQTGEYKTFISNENNMGMSRAGGHPLIKDKEKEIMEI